MEDLEPISDFEQDSFCVELMKRLNLQRGQNYLCDVTLVAREGKEFKAHRNVLTAASPFFAKLLQSDMKEREEGVIRFQEISESVMEDVLEFVYTGIVEISEENVKELVVAADYLLLVCLKTLSGRFLEQQLSISNCISTFYFAEKYQCEELVINSKKFIHDNFASVAEMEEFLNLEAKEVAMWISGDEICIADEEDVFKIMLNWVEQNKSERKAKFEELFRHVRLVLVSRDYLLDIVTNELVRENASCMRTLTEAIELVSCASEDTLMQSPRRRLQTHAIVACGGKYTFCYLPEVDKWKRLADGLSESRSQRTQMVKFRDQLYTFPGNSKAERYDPTFNGWASLGMRVSGYPKLAVVTCTGQIYAVHVDGFYRKSTVKRYDVGLYQWKTIISSDKGCRDDSCVVVGGNYLYVFGGRPFPYGSVYVSKAERFNTVENKWEDLADMQQERGNAFGVATQGKIFVAGGLNRGRAGLRTCEVYNVSTDEWQFIGSLSTPRFLGSMVCVNGTLYVLGGSRVVGREYQFEFTVERYDATANKWIKKTSIPVDQNSEEQKHSFKGGTLKLSKGVLEQVTEIQSGDDF